MHVRYTRERLPGRFRITFTPQDLLGHILRPARPRGESAERPGIFRAKEFGDAASGPRRQPIWSSDGDVSSDGQPKPGVQLMGYRVIPSKLLTREA